MVTALILKELHMGPTPYHVGLFGGKLSQTINAPDLIELTQKLASDSKVTFQLVDAAKVASPNHLLFAAIHAVTAFNRGTERAATLGMETLRFAAAQRQISQALKLLGLSESTQIIGGVIISENVAKIQNTFQTFLRRTNVTADHTVLEVTSKKKERTIQDTFQISNEELDAISPSKDLGERRQALQKLVYDRCALLAISR